MFKIGDTVTVKNLTDTERAQYAFYNDIMKKYEGQKGQITRITTNEYVVQFSDHRKWCWLKEWIEPETIYCAF